MSILSRLGNSKAEGIRSFDGGSVSELFANEDGEGLARLLSSDDDADGALSLSTSDGGEQSELGDALSAAVDARRDGNATEAFAAFNHASMLLLNGATSAGRWVLPALFAASLRLFSLAVHADTVLAKRSEKPRCLEEAARTLNKAFSVCATDRFNTLPTSRKWGSYYMCNLLFRTYFRLRQINLAGNLIRSLKSVDLPDLDQFPIAHAVTYRYYMGVLAFYDEQYKRAQGELTWALQNFPPLTTHPRKHNQALLLSHLIPVNLIAGRIPSPALLGAHPRLRALFADLIDALGAGRLGDFDVALAERQRELIGRGVYLTLERSRIVCFRNLVRRVFLIRNKTTRLELQDVLTAVHMAGCTDVDMDEIECMVANLIDKGFVKGYISHERLTLVLSPKDAFPALPSVPF